MRLRHAEADPTSHATPLLAVGYPKGMEGLSGLLADLDEALGGAIAARLAAGDLRGGGKDALVLYGTEKGPQRVVLLGLGDAAKVDAESVRKMGARAVRTAETHKLDSVTIAVHGIPGVDAASAGQAAAEGAGLAAWRFTELKRGPHSDDTPVDVTDVQILGGDADAVEVGAKIAAATNFARTLQSRPGNVATPTAIANAAAEMAGRVGLKATLFDEAALREQGMHAILAVSQGSDEEARLIVLEHAGGPKGQAPLVLVGKGLSFDAGGISLKPPAGMEDMKFDMSGGAAVIGAMQAIAEIGVPANVVGIVPSSENLPSGRAVKPGDVIDTLAGKTVEVINTDAEGRLILADALAYGARLKPAAMVDCATLTGAVVVALGHHAAAVLGNDDALVAELIAAGQRSGERCWQLPMWDEYRKQLESDSADLKNVGGRPGGSITAACFLSEFVGDATWAHLDVAGTAYGDGDAPYYRKGAYGLPTRLLVEWVRSRAG